MASGEPVECFTELLLLLAAGSPVGIVLSLLTVGIDGHGLTISLSDYHNLLIYIGISLLSWRNEQSFCVGLFLDQSKAPTCGFALCIIEEATCAASERSLVGIRIYIY